jgi:hypothetical protein
VLSETEVPDSVPVLGDGVPVDSDAAGVVLGSDVVLADPGTELLYGTEVIVPVVSTELLLSTGVVLADSDDELPYGTEVTVPVVSTELVPGVTDSAVELGSGKVDTPV